MKSLATAITLSGLVLIGGCATAPTGPSIMALPGNGKSFDQFRMDDTDCRNYAFNQVGGTTADQSATDAGVRSAAVGTVIGAVAGAAIGGRNGAGVGAGTGLLVGSMVGTDAAQNAASGTQRNYDHAYVQCMYAKGEEVPVPGVRSRPRSQRMNVPPPPPVPGTYLPPPPPDNIPPPPPSY